MSNKLYGATTEALEALSAATAETLVQLRGATATKARVVAWGVSFNGTTPTAEPVLVELLRQTTDGTGTGATEAKYDPDDPTAAITAFHSFTAEPTAGERLEQVLVHPQGGIYIREYPPGREPVLDDATTSRMAIRATAPAAVSAVAWIQWAE